MKKHHPLILLPCLFLPLASQAWESEDGQHTTSANVALSSDYVWRGYSQTDNEPAISGGFDYSHSSGLYAGTWASNVDFGDNASSEIDVYLGYSAELAETGIVFDVGFLRYIYPDETYSWNEVYTSLAYGPFSIGVAHSNDVYNSSENGTYFSLSIDQPIYDLLMLNAGIGYYSYDDNVYGVANPDSVFDYQLGLSTEQLGFHWHLNYTDTNSDGETNYGRGLADGRFTFTVSKSL